MNNEDFLTFLKREANDIAEFQNASIHAFTLIELSIVLVIIGLIVGSILVGRDLIHTAELRTVISEVNKYNLGVNTFRVKYNCLAGDCPNATEFFGVDPNGCIGAPNDSGRYIATPPINGTCNGNNSEELGEGENNEPFRAWQQLAYASFVPGLYTGTCYDDLSQGFCTGPRQMKAGLDVPASKVMGGTYALVSMEASMQVGFFSTTVDTGHFWPMHYGNVLIYGGDPSTLIGNNLFNVLAPVLSPQDAHYIDDKGDDGSPASGSIVSGNNSKCLTASSTDNTNAAYNLTTGTSKSCILIFKLN